MSRAAKLGPCPPCRDDRWPRGACVKTLSGGGRHKRAEQLQRTEAEHGTSFGCCALPARGNEGPIGKASRSLHLREATEAFKISGIRTRKRRRPSVVAIRQSNWLVKPVIPVVPAAFGGRGGKVLADSPATGTPTTAKKTRAGCCSLPSNNAWNKHLCFSSTITPWL